VSPNWSIPPAYSSRPTISTPPRPCCVGGRAEAWLLRFKGRRQVAATSVGPPGGLPAQPATAACPGVCADRGDHRYDRACGAGVPGSPIDARFRPDRARKTDDGGVPVLSRPPQTRRGARDARWRWTCGRPGSDGSAKIVQSPNHAFDEEVLRVVRGSVYRPAHNQGRTVRVVIRQPVTFVNY